MSANGIDLIPLLMAATALSMAALLYVGVACAFGGGRKRLRRRIAALQKKVGPAPAELAPVGVRLDDADSSIKPLDRLIKRLMPRPAKLRERLARTGRRIYLGEYVLASLLIAGAGLSALDKAGSKLTIALLLAVLMGLGLPYLAIGALIKRRLKRFTALFPEAIDLIVRGVKSGLPVNESIRAVGNELPDPIGVEFRRVSDAMGMGQTLDQALWNAVKMLDTPEFRFFVITLSVQRETGGNLAETLENLATILRRRKQIKLKIRALSAEARTSALIIGSLPFLLFMVLTLVNPDYSLVLIHDPRGRTLLGAALASLFTGGAIIYRMSRFEI
jgi:tight adherence protein B